MSERELDPGEFRCVLCGAISGLHPRDGMGECNQCASTDAVDRWQQGRLKPLKAKRVTTSMERMAEKVAARKVWADPCDAYLSAGTVQAVLQALTPQDWAEGAVERGGMVRFERYWAHPDHRGEHSVPLYWDESCCPLPDGLAWLPLYGKAQGGDEQQATCEAHYGSPDSQFPIRCTKPPGHEPRDHEHGDYWWQSGV